MICKICRRAEYSGGVCKIASACKKDPHLNLGSGLQPYERCINFDAQILSGIQGWDKHLQTDVVGMIEDIVEIFPHGYFAQVQSSHVIEHFLYEESLVFLQNQLLLIRPGGKMVVEGPCILGQYRKYQETGNLVELIEGLYPYRTRMQYGPLMAHKSGWTGPLVAEKLRELGLQVVHVGVGLAHGMGWMDFRVEAVKA